MLAVETKKGRFMAETDEKRYADLKRVLRILERLRGYKARGPLESSVAIAAFDAALKQANADGYEFKESVGGGKFVWEKKAKE